MYGGFDATGVKLQDVLKFRWSDTTHFLTFKASRFAPNSGYSFRWDAMDIRIRSFAGTALANDDMSVAAPLLDPSPLQGRTKRQVPPAVRGKGEGYRESIEGRRNRHRGPCRRATGSDPIHVQVHKGIMRDVQRVG